MIDVVFDVDTAALNGRSKWLVKSALEERAGDH